MTDYPEPTHLGESEPLPVPEPEPEPEEPKKEKKEEEEKELIEASALQTLVEHWRTIAKSGVECADELATLLPPAAPKRGDSQVLNAKGPIENS